MTVTRNGVPASWPSLVDDDPSLVHAWYERDMASASRSRHVMNAPWSLMDTHGSDGSCRSFGHACADADRPEMLCAWLSCTDDVRRIHGSDLIQVRLMFPSSLAHAERHASTCIDNAGQTMGHVAATHGHATCLQVWWDHVLATAPASRIWMVTSGFHGYTMAHVAAYRHHVDCMDVWVSHGGDPLNPIPGGLSIGDAIMDSIGPSGFHRTQNHVRDGADIVQWWMRHGGHPWLANPRHRDGLAIHMSLCMIACPQDTWHPRQVVSDALARMYLGQTYQDTIPVERLRSAIRSDAMARQDAMAVMPYMDPMTMAHWMILMPELESSVAETAS
jgi:hypothetical protein